MLQGAQSLHAGPSAPPDREAARACESAAESSCFAVDARWDESDRFDNAEEMLRAWRKVFEHVDQPPVTPLTDHECDGETTPRLVLDGATLTTPLAAIGLSTRALNALLRVNVLEVRDLLALAPARLVGTRGVGNKTRRELADAFKVLQTAFPDRAEPRAGTASTDDDAEPLRDRVGSRRSRESAAAFTLHGAWILVPSDDLRAAPVLDGKPIPVLSPSEWARLPEAWLRQQEASSRTKPDTVENAASR